MRLKTRMEKAGFPAADAFYQLVCNAYDATHRLHVHVHYLACNGVGPAARGS
jgi:hypothetical protein